MQINDKGNVIRGSPKLEENVWYKLEVEQLIEGNQASFKFCEVSKELTLQIMLTIFSFSLC